MLSYRSFWEQVRRSRPHLRSWSSERGRLVRLKQTENALRGLRSGGREGQVVRPDPAISSMPAAAAKASANPGEGVGRRQRISGDGCSRTACRSTDAGQQDHRRRRDLSMDGNRVWVMCNVGCLKRSSAVMASSIRRPGMRQVGELTDVRWELQRPPCGRSLCEYEVYPQTRLNLKHVTMAKTPKCNGNNNGLNGQGSARNPDCERRICQVPHPIQTRTNPRRRTRRVSTR